MSIQELYGVIAESGARYKLDTPRHLIIVNGLTEQVLQVKEWLDNHEFICDIYNSTPKSLLIFYNEVNPVSRGYACWEWEAK